MHQAPGAQEPQDARQWLVRWAVAAVLTAFVSVIVLGALASALRIADVERRRVEARADRTDSVSAAGSKAPALRRLQATLGDGDRFAFVFGPEVDRDQRGLHHLVALSVLYPAIAVADPEQADAVALVGIAPTAAITTRFAEVEVVDGVWIGRRRR
jgi:hypothetical protein